MLFDGINNRYNEDYGYDQFSDYIKKTRNNFSFIRNKIVWKCEFKNSDTIIGNKNLIRIAGRIGGIIYRKLLESKSEYVNVDINKTIYYNKNDIKLIIYPGGGIYGKPLHLTFGTKLEIAILNLLNDLNEILGDWQYYLKNVRYFNGFELLKEFCRQIVECYHSTYDYYNLEFLNLLCFANLKNNFALDKKNTPLILATLHKMRLDGFFVGYNKSLFDKIQFVNPVFYEIGIQKIRNEVKNYHDNIKCYTNSVRIHNIRLKLLNNNFELTQDNINDLKCDGVTIYPNSIMVNKRYINNHRYYSSSNGVGSLFYNIIESVASAVGVHVNSIEVISFEVARDLPEDKNAVYYVPRLNQQNDPKKRNLWWLGYDNWSDWVDYSNDVGEYELGFNNSDNLSLPAICDEIDNLIKFNYVESRREWRDITDYAILDSRFPKMSVLNEGIRLFKLGIIEITKFVVLPEVKNLLVSLEVKNIKCIEIVNAESLMTVALELMEYIDDS